MTCPKVTRIVDIKAEFNPVLLITIQTARFQFIYMVSINIVSNLGSFIYEVYIIETVVLFHRPDTCLGRFGVYLGS